MAVPTLEHAIIGTVVKGTCKQLMSYYDPLCTRVYKHGIDMAAGSRIDRLAAMAAVCQVLLSHSVECVPLVDAG